MNAEWKEIGSAPRDRLLLLACANWGHSVHGDKPVPVKVGGWRSGGWNVFGASWRPTHWDELPEGPSATAPSTPDQPPQG
jgi:hypothetical protein